MVFCSNYISHHKSPQMKIAGLRSEKTSGFPGDTWNLLAFLRSQEPRWIVFVISELFQPSWKNWGKKPRFAMPFSLQTCLRPMGLQLLGLNAKKGGSMEKKRHESTYDLCLYKTVEYIEWLLAVDLTIQFGTQRSGEEDPIWFFSGLDAEPPRIKWSLSSGPLVAMPQHHSEVVVLEGQHVADRNAFGVGNYNDDLLSKQNDMQTIIFWEPSPSFDLTAKSTEEGPWFWTFQSVWDGGWRLSLSSIRLDFL